MAETAKHPAPVGLTGVEAARRLAEVGPNALTVHRHPSLLGLFLVRFKNPLILLLLGAGAVAAATGDATSAAVVIVMALTSAALDAIQEHKAGNAAEQLTRTVALRVMVLRDGQLVEIASENVVPGDVVELSAGSLVPADGEVVAAQDCFVDQSLLTGEPYPVEKRPGGPPAPGTPPSEAVNALFKGTTIISGSARVLVSGTGRHTALGEIGASLDAPSPPTPFEIGTRRFGVLILRLAIGMVLFVVLVNIARQRPPLESFLFAVALSVGLTPELLPMVISVTLARGSIRMAARKVIVKRQSAIHDLGSMDLLCTDKTGTLTEAVIRLERHLDPLGREGRRVLELAAINSRFESGLRSPLDDAILAHTEIDLAGWTKVDEVPFDFERRRVSVLAAGPDGERILVLKGAFEDVLALSSHYEGDGPADLRSLDAVARREMQVRCDGLCQEGFRVLGVAWKPEPPECSDVVVADEAELVFAGFAGFEDPPKASAGPALRGLAALGVAVKVVTGDNELVSRHVCAQVGLEVVGVMTGPELDRLDDAALAARVEETTIFCRVTPPQKSRVIAACRQRGHVVGYLGDGINDAPSLHSADVGISVAGAVDVAKAAADLILLESDLQVLHDGIVEGRRTFANILKYVMMGTSSNFGNMFSMAGASMVLPFLPMRAPQILVNNFLYDVSELPIPLDNVDEEMIARPRRWDMRFIRNYMLALGPVSSLFDFLTFALLLRVFHAAEAEFQTGWFVESLATQVLVIFVIRTRGNPFRSRPSLGLGLAALGAVGVAVLLPVSPFAPALGFVPLPPAYFGALAGLVLAYLVAAQGMKRWFYRSWAGSQASPLPGPVVDLG
jgi:Mg2+-importing ATPase